MRRARRVFRSEEVRLLISLNATSGPPKRTPAPPAPGAAARPPRRSVPVWRTRRAPLSGGRRARRAPPSAWPGSRSRAEIRAARPASRPRAPPRAGGAVGPYFAGLGTSAATPKAARCPVARSIVFSTCWFSACGFWKSVLELFRIVVTGAPNAAAIRNAAPAPISTRRALPAPVARAESRAITAVPGWAANT